MFCLFSLFACFVLFVGFVLFVFFFCKYIELFIKIYNIKDNTKPISENPFFACSSKN